MKKILNLKKWLTLSEAATYLSLSVNETVSEADLLFFALNKEINLSVEFVNGTSARRGVFVTSDMPNFPQSSTKDAFKFDSDTYMVLDTNLTPATYLDPYDAKDCIRGIYDLPLMGTATVYLTERYQALVGGPQVDLLALCGPVVQEGENYYLLQKNYENDPLVSGSLANREAREKKFEGKAQSELEEELAHWKCDRDFILKFSDNGCVPASRFPADTVLGVRSDELREFLKRLDPVTHQAVPEKSVATNERYTLLVLIAALCAKAGIDTNLRGAATQLALLTRTEVGVELDDGTVRSKLKQIPDALGSRQK